ncbi:hypothetical protein [Armatimonas sp.]|uniref:hypothetical protein n=1 Tax=Armatimonas sp. TaxID=1872638 RepID=UPI00286C6C6C|nr:hypothetical protein [Armatimonas sp.]
MKFAVGTSIIEEFAVGHDPSAVLRELVQNEYDAGGQKMAVNFGEQALEVQGTGKPIEDEGWRRLSVMMGTGEVSGGGTQIAAKTNGIGSKNFGLRSLFLFGDQIHVRSNGQRTLLDRFHGAYEQPVTDPDYSAKKGVAIHVPYRTQKSSKLEPFAKEQEEAALNGIVADFTQTVLKLAQPGKPEKSLRELIIISARCGRAITWKQRVEEVPCRQQGIHLVKRSLRLNDSQTTTVETVEELEWRKNVLVPEEFRQQAYPSYFKVAGGRVRLSISLQTKRGKPIIDKPGLFYYPIGAGGCHTGTALSVTAPFEMNNNRSELVPPGNNPWNQWLLTAAVDLVFDLLKGDWYERLGADGFLALKEITEPATHQFLDSITKRLREDKCWPTRDREEESKKTPVLAIASGIVIPAHNEMDKLMPETWYLDDGIGNDLRIKEFAKGFGAKKFTCDSLVNLLCAGSPGLILKTKVDKKTDSCLHWTHYPTHFRLRSERGKRVLRGSPSLRQCSIQFRPR